MGENKIRRNTERANFWQSSWVLCREVLLTESHSHCLFGFKSVCLHSHCLFGFKSVCLLTPSGASAITGGSCHKYHFCLCLTRQKTCFVATNTCLSRQTRVSGDKSFVATKMILMAAPASDNQQLSNMIQKRCTFWWITAYMIEN